MTFHLKEETLAILGITTYMLGLSVGSVILAPLSEMYGRRPIYLIAIVMFGILTIPCALAPNLEAILISRFFGAIAGSAMISNAPGTVNDIVLEKHRALAFSIWSIGPMNGNVPAGESQGKPLTLSRTCDRTARRRIRVSISWLEVD